MKTPYASQYKHPQWQKKRLEALEFYGFACDACSDTETTLHVHHKFYVKGRKVWEYEVEDLEVLCESCHDETHALREQLAEVVATYTASDLPQLVRHIRGFSRSAIGPKLDEEIAACEDPTDYYIGIIADLLGCMDAESQRAVGEIVLASIQRRIPGATGLHDVIRQAIQAFRGLDA